LIIFIDIVMHPNKATFKFFELETSGLIIIDCPASTAF
jgi:hypothetical protein